MTDAPLPVNFYIPLGIAAYLHEGDVVDLVDHETGLVRFKPAARPSTPQADPKQGDE